MEKKRNYIRDYTGDDSIAAFLAFAVEEYAVHKGIGSPEAAELLGQCRALDHLAEFYDVMHTQSRDWLMVEIDNLVNQWNKTK